LSYQWQKNGTNVIESAKVKGAAARVLRLGNLTLADAGTYSVIVTNTSGSVASAEAVLRIAVSPPVLQIVSQSGANLVLAWSTSPGRVYQLQAKPELASASWSNIGVPLTATADSLQTSLAIGLDSQQFYRVILLP
jgi:hypothetical protein